MLVILICDLYDKSEGGFGVSLLVSAEVSLFFKCVRVQHEVYACVVCLRVVYEGQVLFIIVTVQSCLDSKRCFIFISHLVWD